MPSFKRCSIWLSAIIKDLPWNLWHCKDDREQPHSNLSQLLQHPLHVSHCVHEFLWIKTFFKWSLTQSSPTASNYCLPWTPSPGSKASVLSASTTTKSPSYFCNEPTFLFIRSFSLFVLLLLEGRFHCFTILKRPVLQAHFRYKKSSPFFSYFSLIQKTSNERPKVIHPVLAQSLHVRSVFLYSSLPQIQLSVSQEDVLLADLVSWIGCLLNNKRYQLCPDVKQGNYEILKYILHKMT